jgi:hypothetical protein
MVAAQSKIKLKITLEQATKVQRGSGCKLYASFILGATWGWVVNATPRPLYYRYPVPIV